MVLFAMGDFFLWLGGFLPLGPSAEEVMSLPPSVRLSVCPSVHFWLVCAITRQVFNLSSPNFAPIMHLVNLQAAFENGVD